MPAHHRVTRFLHRLLATSKVRFQWGRMASCAAIGNRRACRLPTGTQFAKVPHEVSGLPL